MHSRTLFFGHFLAAQHHGADDGKKRALRGHGHAVYEDWAKILNDASLLGQGVTVTADKVENKVNNMNQVARNKFEEVRSQKHLYMKSGCSTAEVFQNHPTVVNQILKRGAVAWVTTYISMFLEDPSMAEDAHADTGLETLGTHPELLPQHRARHPSAVARAAAETEEMLQEQAAVGSLGPAVPQAGVGAAGAAAATPLVSGGEAGASAGQRSRKQKRTSNTSAGTGTAAVAGAADDKDDDTSPAKKRRHTTPKATTTKKPSSAVVGRALSHQTVGLLRAATEAQRERDAHSGGVDPVVTALDRNTMAMAQARESTVLLNQSAQLSQAAMAAAAHELRVLELFQKTYGSNTMPLDYQTHLGTLVETSRKDREAARAAAEQAAAMSAAATGRLRQAVAAVEAAVAPAVTMASGGNGSGVREATPVLLNASAAGAVAGAAAAPATAAEDADVVDMVDSDGDDN